MSDVFHLNSFDTLIVFDLETSGLDGRRDRVIEFGAVTQRGQSPDAPEETDFLIRLPEGKTLPTAITRLTGITDRDLREQGVSEARAAAQIADMLSEPNTLLVAYNAQFDLVFLYWLLQRNDRASCLKHVKLLDALTVYRDRRPYPHKLSDAIASYRLSGSNSHRSLDDAKATLELLCRMQEERDDLERYLNLFGYHPKYGVSGQRISSVTYRPQGFFADRPLYESQDMEIRRNR